MGMKYRTVVSDGDGLDFVLSDDSLDRHGTRINPAGWEIGNFLKNPVALFRHSSDFPIGTWTNVRHEGSELRGTLQLAKKGTSARIDELISLVKQGILRAVSVGFHVVEEGIPGKSAFDIDRAELIEASLVAVPSNPNALALARALQISEPTISMAFGGQAETRRIDADHGGQAGMLPTIRRHTPMTTLSQRIEDAQNELNLKCDKLTELTAAAELDLTAIEEINDRISKQRNLIATLQTSERALASTALVPVAQATPGIARPAMPAIMGRRPLGYPPTPPVKGLDLLVRQIVVYGCSHFGRQPMARVLEDRYPGCEHTELMCRADQTIGKTNVPGWAQEIVRTNYGDYIEPLRGRSIYPVLRDRGVSVSFDGFGTVSIPGSTGTGAAGSFVAEGEPIRVGRLTTISITMTPRKLGVIIPFSRELAKRSTPTIESLVRIEIVAQTAKVLDQTLLDNGAETAARPAGLLNGVAAAAVGAAGTDFNAVIADFNALLAPFDAADASDNITVIMHPKQMRVLSMMPGPGDGRFGWADAFMSRLTVVESSHTVEGRLIAIRNSDFATATGDMPEFDVSESATLHMEDTAPLELHSAAGVAADPQRSLWQTATIGIRMLMDVTWKMRRSGMVQWIDNTNW